MPLKERTSLRLKEPVRTKLNEKFPNLNLSLFLNNILEYLLTQDDEVIQEFTVKHD